MSHPDPYFDIIVPVYNALEDVQACVQSILANRCGFELRLILVNDASQAETTQWLRQFARTDPAVQLIEHEQNQGYSKACNTGLAEATAPFVILMNSDTIPSASWLTDMLDCLASDERIGIVSPLSNSAVKQSVPSLQDIFSSTVNSPGQQQVNDFAELVKAHSWALNPVYPFIHGFCHLIRRDVIDNIGVIDAQSFPNGMGSEIEYCMRAAQAGFLSAVADHAFVYHGKAKSLTSSSRLNEDWRDRIAERYGQDTFQQALDAANDYPALNAIRAATSHSLFQQKLDNRVGHFCFNILILLGHNRTTTFLEQWLNQVRTMNLPKLHWHIAVPEEQLDQIYHQYKHLSDISALFIGYQDQQLLHEQARYYDGILINDFRCLPSLLNMLDDNPDILPILLLDRDWQAQGQNPLPLHDHICALEQPLLLADNRETAACVDASTGMHCWLAQPGGGPPRLRERILLTLNSRSLIAHQKPAERLLRLIHSHLLKWRLNRPMTAFSKGKPATNGFQTLHARELGAPPLIIRRLKKLRNNPHAWFADSGNALLRPLRHLFRPRSN